MDLCGADVVHPDVLLGRFPSGSYTVVLIENEFTGITLRFNVTPPDAPRRLVDYSGMWWTSSEPGWGLSLWQSPSGTIFGVWAVYDAARNATWYTLITQPGAYDAYNGTVYRAHGPYFGGGFDPSQVAISPAGTATLLFSDSNSAVFFYLVDGAAGRKDIVRQVIE